VIPYLPPISLPMLMTIAGYIALIAMLIGPVVAWVRLEFAVKNLKADVADLNQSVGNMDTKIDNLLVQIAGWFANPAARRRTARATGRKP
jgi:hypothetical protein